MRLDDPHFEAQFIAQTEGNNFRTLDSIDGAQGLLMYCPCGEGHHCQIPFANPRNAPQLTPNFGPVSRDGKTHFRWTMTGTGLSDLTLTPSVDIGKDKSCWHGFITNGEVQ